MFSLPVASSNDVLLAVFPGICLCAHFWAVRGINEAHARVEATGRSGPRSKAAADPSFLTVGRDQATDPAVRGGWQ